MRRLEFTEIARVDLKSIRRYSHRTWGPERTVHYMAELRDAMKGLLAGTVVSRNRDDLGPELEPRTENREGELSPRRSLVSRRVGYSAE